MFPTDIYKHQRIYIVLSNTFSLSKINHMGLKKNLHKFKKDWNNAAYSI